MASPTIDRRLGLIGNVAMKAPVTVLAASNITLAGEQTIDGVAVLESNARSVPDRVLCIAQDDATENGIWDVSTGSWTRSLDANGNYDLVQGSTVLVTRGTTYAGSYWKIATADRIVFGTTEIEWTRSLTGTIDTLSFLQAGTGAAVRAALDKMRDIVNVKDFGAVGDGSSHPLSGYFSSLAIAQVVYPHATSLTQEIDWAAIQSALNTGKEVRVPAGTYRVTTGITLPTGARLIGDGERLTTISSNIVGNYLFYAEPTGASFIRVSDMRLNGNSLTGANGSGHCFNFIDPAPLTGSATPQNTQLENLWIYGFKGQDDADENGVTKIASAAVMMFGALQVTLNRVYAEECGHGFYVRRTQNCRIRDSIAVNILQAGVFAYDNENLIFDGCDILDCQQNGNTTDAGYPVSDSDLAGNFLSYLNNNLVIANTKLKGFRGKALMVFKGDGQNIVVENCWIRGDAQADQPHKAIYAERIAGLVIRKNTFSPSNTGFSASQKYQTIELYTPSTAPAFLSTIEDNVFQDVSGFPIEYNIKIGGNGTTRSHRTTIRNNRFGSNTSRSSACVVDTDILLSNCLVDSGDISNNSHFAITNVTRTACVTASSIAIQKTKIGPSLFQASGGTITANYSGITESVLTGLSTGVNPSSLADGAGETHTLTVTGAETQDFAQASFENNLQGIIVTAWVSAADTVSVRFQNETGGTIDLGSGSLRARVSKTWAA